MSWQPWPELIGEGYALGLNYADHAREAALAAQPVVFRKSCRPAPGATEVCLPSRSAIYEKALALDPALCARLRLTPASIWPGLDSEVELGLILREDYDGRCDGLPALGYFLANDISLRGLQLMGEGSDEPLKFWQAAKSFPGFLPVSAQLWVAEPAWPDWPDWPDWRLRCAVRGRWRQDASLQQMLLSPRQLLDAVMQTAGRPLRAGDWILSGTPAGVALRLSARQRRWARYLPASLRVRAAWQLQKRRSGYLHVGDELEMRLEDWPALHCRIVAAP